MPDEAALQRLGDEDTHLRVAKWHLDEIGRMPRATTTELASLVADHADVVTVFAAAAVEARLNQFILSPLLFMREEGPRRFMAELVTEHLRLAIPQRLKFLGDRASTLKESKVLSRVRELCERRNRILHVSFEYEEVKSLPDQPYLEGLHRHLPESAFVQRPRLSTARTFTVPPQEQARTDYETACEFLKVMFDVRPYEPWPPPDLT